MSGNSTTMCSLKLRAHPEVQKICPFDVAKEVGRGAAGLAADDLLDTVWFREAERAWLTERPF